MLQWRMFLEEKVVKLWDEEYAKIGSERDPIARIIEAYWNPAQVDMPINHLLETWLEFD